MEPSFAPRTHRRQRDQRVALVMGAVLVFLFLAIAAVVLLLGGSPSQPAAAVATPTPSASIAPVVDSTPAPTLMTPAATAGLPVITGAPATPAPTADAGATLDPNKTAPPSTPTLAPGEPTPSFVPPPPNDSIDRPTVITSLPASHRLTAVGATTEAADAECYGTASGGTVWFSFTPSSAMTVGATTFGSDYDTILHVGTRGASGNFNSLACNDDAGGTGQSALRVDLDANVTYLFMAGSYHESASGDLVFTLEAAEPMPTLSLTLDEVGTFDARGRATLSGTYSCSSRVDGGGSVSVLLRQRVGRQIFTGDGDAELERCGRRTRSWSLVVASYEGTFGDEPAFATVWASICDEFDCRTVNFEQPVTLVSDAPSPSPAPVTPSPAPVTPSPAPVPSATADGDAAAEPSIQPVP